MNTELIHQIETEIGENPEYKRSIYYLYDLKQPQDSFASESDQSDSSSSDSDISNYSDDISLDSQDSDYQLNIEIIKQLHQSQSYKDQMIEYMMR